ncbi:MAG: hypothetical protein J6Z09_08800 [Lachnospiraceae bacterium]|nr:hypothetical protein [Lachnospiraceae bacterium]
MSLAKSKNDFSKRDMNFFSEFSSAASQNFSSAFPFFLLVALSILVITIVVWVICNFSIMKKNNEKNQLLKDMADPQYQQQLAQKDTVQAEVEELQEYHYVLSSLESRLGTVAVSDVETMKAVVNSLPNDTILTYYDDLEGIVEIHGTSLNQKSPQNYMHLLEQTGRFSFTQAKILPFDPVKNGYNQDNIMFGTMKYEFEFKCTIKGHYMLSRTKFLDGKNPQPITEKQYNQADINEVKTLEGISKVEVNGTTYELTNVKINSVAISAQALEEAKRTDKLKVTVTSNTDVELYYSVPKAAAKDGGKS